MAGKYVDIRLTTDVNFKMMLSSSPEMRKDLERVIQTIMWEARNMVSDRLKNYMRDSAHDAYRAVRNVVYRRVIGGELNILNVRRALRKGHVTPSWRGRTKDTERILSYHGVDRGFILRFVNDGTAERWTTHMDGHPMKRKSVDERPKSREYVYPNRLGGRGGAAMRNGNTLGMFRKEAEPVMAAKSMEFQNEIDKLIDKYIK